jgi:cytidylate kinase
MPILTVSRQYGSGGSAIAERVATAMGWTLYDNDVIEQVASRLGMTAVEVAAREERVPSLVERLTNAMALGVPEVMPMIGDMMSRPSEERMVHVTQLVLEEAVRAGPAVLVGRGAQCMLAARSDTLHVYCYAPFDALVRYAIAHLDAPPAEAPRRVSDINHQREEYVKRHWKRNWRDFTNYDICLNTARLGLDASADLVLQAVRARFPDATAAPV